MEDNNKDFEDLFKEKFEDFEPEVDSKVWKNVKTGIKVAGVGVIGKFLINKLGTNALIAIVSSLVTVIGTVSIMNWTKAQKENPIVEKTVVEPAIKVNAPEQLTPEEIKEFLNNDIGADNNSTIKNETKAPANIIKEQPKAEKTESASPSNLTSTISIASILPSATSGVAPLAIEVINAGEGKKNIWMLGDKKNNNESPAYLFDKPGIYTIKLLSTNAAGKSQMDSVKIEVFANSGVNTDVFELSPNGDGKYDTFTINAPNIVRLEAKIYNKPNGKLIYQWSEINGKWDGRDFNGKNMEAGLYYYFVVAFDKGGTKHERTGYINLER